MPEGALLLLALLPAAAAEVRVDRGPTPSVHPAVRGALGAHSYLIVIDGRNLARFWFSRRIRRAPRAAPGVSPLLRQGMNYEIAPAALVGAVELAAQWTDAKGQRIPAGTYTLLYLPQPLMKEHRGISEFRDFLVLVPGGDALGVGGLESVVASSLRVSGTAHPAVLALVPASEVTTPRVRSGPAGRQILEARAGGIPIGLVLSSDGPG